MSLETIEKRELAARLDLDQLALELEDGSRLTARLLTQQGLSPNALVIPAAEVLHLVIRAHRMGERVGFNAARNVRRCRLCGCTEFAACRPHSCSWVETDLCSACLEPEGIRP